MEAWTEQQQTLVRSRISERLAKAADRRRAAMAHPAGSTESIRLGIGRLLIQAGRRVAGESTATGSTVVKPSRTMAG